MQKALMIVLLATLAGTRTLWSQSDSIHVLASGGIKGVLEKIQPECERRVSHKLFIEYNSTAVIKQRVEAGEPFDAFIGASDAVRDLSNQGQLAGPHPDISRVGIGIGAKTGDPKPDIKTADSLKRALLNAKSVTYGQGGASAGGILSMFEKLGIADEMKAKANPLAGADLTTGSVVEGKNQYVITLVSEILPVKGLQLVGPLPGAFQQYTSFAISISAKPQNTDAAKFLGCFAGPQVHSAYRILGMEPMANSQ